jgi:hypothetical protein
MASSEMLNVIKRLKSRSATETRSNEVGSFIVLQEPSLVTGTR